MSNSEVYGVFKKGHLLEGIPIAGLIGDQQAALVGNKCLTKGDAKNTYGALSLSTSSSRRAANCCCLAARQSHALADPSTRNRQSHCRYGLLHALQHGHRHCQVDARSCHHRASPLAAFRQLFLCRVRADGESCRRCLQVGYKMGPQSPMHYALEGSIAVGGSSVTW